MSKRLPYFSSIGLLAQALDRVGEVEVDAATEVADHRADAAALVAHVLGLARGDVTRDEVAEGRVDALEVVVAVGLGDRARVLVAVLGASWAPRSGRRCGATRT
jgi:hypothetical protein